MRSFLRMVLLGLVLVLVAMVSALTAMRFAIHGREATVPKLVGLTPADARRVSAINGLLLVTENRFYSTDVPAGRIVSQLPQPGERVRRGWQVRVAESLGPQRRVIPNLLGESERAAEINLRRHGLEIGTVAGIPRTGAAIEDVVAQSPAPEAAASSPVVSLLVVAAPPPPEFVMPNLVGRRLADVSGQLEQAGIKLGKVEEVAGSATGMILRQSPAPGQKITSGSAVSVQVSQ
jgi:eukaryotic-like serine/threonine-protein kinase